MKRRSFLLSLALLPSFAACAADELLGTLKKPRSYWKPLLPVAAYKVLFEEDTEAPGSSALLNEHGQGHFICAACYQPLFASEKKFESGTGWPSFWQPIDAAVATQRDFKLFLPRTEYHCSRCGGHQGHVFEDGPKPTGLRYCNNGLALNFVPQAQSLPALRG